MATIKALREADERKAAAEKRAAAAAGPAAGDSDDTDKLLAGFAEDDLKALGMDVPEDNKALDEAAMQETVNECPKCGFKW